MDRCSQKLLSSSSPLQSYEHFGDLMRYNNWKHDPLSEGNPFNAIMARGSLPWPAP